MNKERRKLDFLQGLYEVTDDGRLFSCRSGKYLSPDKDRYGYLYYVVSIADLDLLTIGLVNDMFTERQNDEYPYKELATQSDFDKF